MDPVIFEQIVRALFLLEEYPTYLALRATNNYWSLYDTDQICKEAFLKNWSPLVESLLLDNVDWEHLVVRSRFMVHPVEFWELPNSMVLAKDDPLEVLRTSLRLHGNSLFSWTTYNGSSLAATFSLSSRLIDSLPSLDLGIDAEKFNNDPHAASSIASLFKTYFLPSTDSDWTRLSDFTELVKYPNLEFSPFCVTHDVLSIRILSPKEVIGVICPLEDVSIEVVRETVMYLMHCVTWPPSTSSGSGSGSGSGFVDGVELTNAFAEWEAVKLRLTTFDILLREMACARYEWATFGDVRDDVDYPRFFTDCGYSSTAAMLVCLSRGSDYAMKKPESSLCAANLALGSILPHRPKTYLTMLASHDAS
jgi:hypothetical protein